MLDSFRSRLVISNLLITLVGLLVVVGVFTSILVQRSTDVRKSDRAQQARRIAVQVDALFARHGRNAELQQLVSLSGRLLQARIIIVGTDGLPFNGFKEARGSSKFYRLDPNALKQAESAVVALRQNNNYYTFQSPLLGTHGRPAGAVLLVARVADVRPELGSLGGVFVAVLITALLVWLTIGLYFTFSISRPLVRIRRATVRMAQGDYDVRVPAQGDGEIALLASRFNEMAERVQSSNRVLRDFVANVSHDLRTPLTMITGFSQALLDGTAGPGEVTTSAEYIYEESVKMQRLVEDLLTLSALESDQSPVSESEFAVVPLLLAVSSDAKALSGGRHEVTLTIRDAATLLGSRDELASAFGNLVSNAVRYTPEGGRIALEWRITGDGGEFTVTDSGIGIASEHVPRLTERFYRVDVASSREKGGTGLGLAIVKHILNRHKGELAIASMPGKGSTFTIMLNEARASQPDKGAATG